VSESVGSVRNTKPRASPSRIADDAHARGLPDGVDAAAGVIRIRRADVDGIHQMPKPVQSGGVPVWISGTVNNAVARLIARFASGWIPWEPAYADMPGASSAAIPPICRCRVSRGR
jgi:alkanesulfonate monooxygenase SsuD/methylene tetrahydromethanopterin reductase-like flavin-dependent oxidoreductase (luciferase family)